MRRPIAERHAARLGGFTLVEIAFVIVILGLLLAMIAGVAAALVGQQRREVTRQRLAGIETAIALFVSQNKRLPCPADGRIAGNAVGARVRGVVLSDEDWRADLLLLPRCACP